ncbi:MAG: dihydroorotase family protein [Candidatus Dormiibacterota bacterium]
MTQLDLAILNGTLVDESGKRNADVGISDGRIVEIVDPGMLGHANQIADAAERWVLPGFVDAHFHCRAPDHPEREDFASGTGAAAAGGVTTVLEMPVADVGTSTVERLLARRTLAESQALVDFGLFAGCGSLDEQEVDGLAKAGAIGFKVFTHRPAPGRENAFNGLWLTDNAEVLRALDLVRHTGLPCAFHAEDDSLLQYYSVDRGTTSSSSVRYRDSRPPVVEAMAVARLAVLAEATGARIHIVHVTSKWALELIRAAQVRGVTITAETCPHYMFFTDEATQAEGVWAKVAPPFRSAEDAAAMIQGVAEGTLELICSDHAPFAEADRSGKDIMEAPSGVPGVEIFAHLALDAALRDQIPLQTVIRSLTIGPARLYGIYPRKGCLAVGSDGDVIIYDPRAETTVHTASWITRSRASARLFEGHKYRGRVEMTFVRGELVYASGRIVGREGHGMMIRPMAFDEPQSSPARQPVIGSSMPSPVV